MKKRNAYLLLSLAIAIASSVSCGDDVVGEHFPIPPQRKLDLTKKTNVLNNIEYAYNKKDANTYQQLLDPNFTFFYNESDANGQTPVQWGYNDEVKTTEGVFGAALSIAMDLSWEDGVAWIEHVAGSETWYDTTVFYHFTIKIGDTTYLPNAGAKAIFTVRNAGTTEKPVWKLVEFRDLGGPSFAAMRVSSTQPTTWGQVKALYRK